jgi:hypothetical protein
VSKQAEGKARRARLRAIEAADGEFVDQKDRGGGRE